MPTNYPAAADDGTTLPDPASGNFLNSPDHASLHGNANGAIKAIETKLGTGSSTPTNNTFLVGDGTGTSAWSTITSAQLAARLSDETGSGAAVFASTPILITPSVDTINESTPANGVTVDGLNIKDGKLNTNDSITTNSLTDSSVGVTKLSTSAITLGYSQATSNQGSIVTDTDITGLSVTFTAPQNGRRIKVTASIHLYSNSAGDAYRLLLKDGSTVIQMSEGRLQAVTVQQHESLHYSTIPTAGSHTYKLSLERSSGTGTLSTFHSSTRVGSLLIEAV